MHRACTTCRQVAQARGVQVRWSVGDLERLDAVDPRAAQAVGLAGALDVGDLVGDLVEDQLDLQPGQVRTDAVVRSVAAEPEVVVVLAVDVELVGLVEVVLVEVATRVEQADTVALLDQLAVDLDVLRSEEHTSELQSLMRTSYA